MKIHSCMKAYVAASLIFSTCCTPSVYAEEGERMERSLEEVTVTARRREESIQDVPVAITALSAESLVQQSVVSFDDLSSKVSSLFVGVSPRGGHAPYVSLRSISMFDASATNDPGVGIYVNDVSMMRAQGVNQTLYDVESVQVLKGPQGTLFGRNSLGGAILINTKKPTDELGGYMRARVGNYDLRDIEGAVNLPVNDKLKFRLAGKVAKHDGYVESLSSPSDFNDLDATSYRLSMTVNPTDKLESTFIYEDFDSDEAGVAVNAVASLPGSTTNVSGIASAVALNDFWKTEADLEGDTFLDLWGVTNITAFEVNDAITLKNIANYREWDAGSANDLDGTRNAILHSTVFGSYDQWSEEFQVQGTHERVEWILGLYHFEETAREGSRAQVGARRNITQFHAKNESSSAFGHIGYELTPKTTLSTGARWTKDKRYINNDSVAETPPGSGVFNCVVRLTPTSPILNPCELKNDASFDEPTWSLSLDYQLNEDTLLYAAHRHGYRSGGLSNRGLTIQEQGPFNAETIDDIELGMKKDFSYGNTSGRLNLAMFYAENDDIQRNVTRISPLTGGLQTVTENAASGTIRGGEIELSLLVGNNLDLSAWFSYSDSKYDEFNETASTGAIVDRSDNDWPFAPVRQGGITARYTVPGVFGGDAVLQANYYAQSDYNISVINFPQVEVDSYGVLNLRMELNGLQALPMDLAIFANNVNDKEYYSGGGTSVAALNVFAMSPAAPRTYGLELIYRFGAEAR